MPKPRGMGLQIGLAFAAVAAGTALIAVLILTSMWQRQFESYVRAGLQERANGVATSMAQIYASDGDWEHTPVVEFGHMAMMNNVRIQLHDASGRLVADTASPLMGLLRSRSSDDGALSGASATAPVLVQGIRVGTVRVYALSTSGILGPRDLEFRQSSLDGLTLAAILAVVLATLAGAVYARILVRPISRLTEVASALRSGVQARTGMRGHSAIGVLGQTLDEMADAIDADRDFERRLTADVAHELRTPLQAIQAMVEGMQDGIIPADADRLGIVRDETLRLARLADGILELARLERGVVPFHMREIDLAETVASAVQAHSALFESSGLTLETEAPGPLMVKGDEDRLRQAIGNLLSNAARYTPEGGRVSVRAFPEGADVLVEVVDTGRGIPADEVDKVFQRFWRAEAARESSQGGLGVGLAVVKEIVERHGGGVAVTSALGEGSVFRLRFPVLA